MLKVALGLTSVVSAGMEIAFRDDAKGADRGEHPTFGAIDFVRAVAFSHRAALMAAWQIEVLREHIARIAIGRTIAFAATATASVAEVVAIALT